MDISLESARPIPPKPAHALVWFRRDLRIHDHPVLARALQDAAAVWCVFILDRTILETLSRRDRRVEFIRDSLVDLDTQIAALAAQSGATAPARLIVRYADPTDEIPRLAQQLSVCTVYAHHDDDPAAIARDERIAAALDAQGCRFVSAKDHVVFERREIMTAAGTPYGVFTPYKAAWLKRLHAYPEVLGPRPSDVHGAALAATPAFLRSPWRDHAAVPALEEFGFERSNLAELGLRAGTQGGEALLEEFIDRIDDYDAARDFPMKKGPSYLGVHLRFGTLSIRRLVALAVERIEAGSQGAQTWLSELIWREFYQQVLFHHPHVVQRAFRAECDAIRWEQGPHSDTLFNAWCQGRTGYPLVDAGMRQLLHSGYMHNRLRMLTASFLTKDLGISWQRGEAYFAAHLIDYERASNNGGWQWAASTGCDAQPWFRIFNPVTQSERFDPRGAFIRRYIPELSALPDKLIHAPWRASPAQLQAANVVLGRDYPPPIVDHTIARERTLARFGARGQGRPMVYAD